MTVNINNYYGFVRAWRAILNRSFFLFSLIKIITIRCKNTQKERKANVSATYGGPLRCHKFKDYEL